MSNTFEQFYMLFSQKKILFWALVLWSFSLFSQTKNIDSLYNKILLKPDSAEKIDKLLKLNRTAHYNRSDILEKALEIATDIYNIEGLAKVYDQKGYIARRNNHFIKSIEYHKRALGFLEKTKDTTLKTRCLNNLGVSCRKANLEKEAYKYYIMALVLAKAQHDKREEARILNGIGNVFVNTEEYEKALFYFEKALSIEKKLNRLRGQEYNIANIGEVYIYQKVYDSAEVYLKKSLELAQTLYKSGNTGIEHNLLGLLYKNKGEYIKSIFHYREAIPMLKNRNIKRYIANSYINMGLSELFLGKSKQAFIDINKGLKIAKEIGSKENISLGYNALVTYYSKTKKYKDALDAHILAKKFHDSIVNIATKNSIISAQIIYETKEKDEKIKQLAYEKELEKETSRRNFLRMIGIGVFSILLISFTYLFFNLKRRNQDLELEQKNSEIQKYLSKINSLENKSLVDKGKLETDIDEKLKDLELTKRERDVLKFVMEGHSNEEISQKMFISKNTVKSHVKNIYNKLDVKNRIQAVKKISEA